MADHLQLQWSHVKRELEDLEQRLNQRIDAAADRILLSLMNQLDFMQRQISKQMDKLRQELRNAIQRDYDTALRGNTLHPEPENIIVGSGHIDSVSDDPDDIWNKALNIVRAQLNNEAMFDCWFVDTKLVQLDSDTRTAVVATDTPFVQLLLENRYAEMVAKVLSAITHQDFQVKFVVRTEVRAG
jgi:DNA-directed RNA polymerase